MAEAIGLSIGFAALFSTCVECFDYFKAAESYEKDCRLLLLKLDLQKERLLVCGEKIKLDTANLKLAERCLEKIRDLLNDAETLTSKYKLKPVPGSTVPDDNNKLSSNATKRWLARVGKKSAGASVLRRAVWAIHDRDGFEALVNHLRDLIDALVDIAPAQPAQEEMVVEVQKDIESLGDDLETLYMIKDACEDVYPEFSETASAAIDASEIGTMRGTESIMNDLRLTNGQGLSRSRTGDNMTARTLTFQSREGSGKLHEAQSVFFVLTDPCMKFGTNEPCDQNELGAASFNPSSSFFSGGSFATARTPGHRISAYVDPAKTPDKNRDDLIRDQFQIRYRLAKHEWPAFEARVSNVLEQYSVNIYIYCAPCACQVATALDIAGFKGKPELVRYSIRVDPRLRSCCSASDSGIAALNSLVEWVTAKEKTLSYEYGYDNQPDEEAIKRLRAIDISWSEEVVYSGQEAEGEDDFEFRRESESDDLLGRILLPHTSKLPEPSKCAGVLILGEVDYCIKLMSSSPFPELRTGELPRERQIYRYQQQESDAGLNWKRTFMGSFTTKDPPKASTRAR